MSAAMMVALFFTVALLVTTTCFIMGSIPLLVLRPRRSQPTLCMVSGPSHAFGGVGSKTASKRFVAACSRRLATRFDD